MSTRTEFLDEVRSEAKPGIWTQGVNLARQGTVALQAQTASEVELRVRAPGRPVPLTVVLYPNDASWECDCPGRMDPCEHVVAAAIAFQQAEKQDAPMQATAARWSRVVYHLRRLDGGLQLQRALVHADGREEPLEGSVAGLLAKPAMAATLQIEQFDLQADRLLERPTRLALPPERLEALLKILEPARSVLLDGRPVAISGDPIHPRAVVEDRNGQFQVTVRRDPRVTEVVSPGVALCGDMLARLGETSMTGARLEQLPIVKTYPPEQLGELSARLLPELARRMPVEVKSARIPAIDRELRPRVVLELNQVDAGLSVLPTLVYGAPPHVRIDNGRMVYLRGAVPLRDEAAEQRLVHELRDELNLVPGRRTTVAGPEMVRWADKLRRWRGGLTGDARGLVNPNVKLVPQLQVASGTTGARRARRALPALLPGRRERRAPRARSRRRRWCAPGARGWGWCRSTGAGGRRCRRSGSTSTARASPSCSRRGARAASSRTTRSPS